MQRIINLIAALTPVLALILGCNKSNDDGLIAPAPATAPTTTVAESTISIVNQSPDAAPESSIDNSMSSKFMMPGYCYAGSRIPDEKALGGFGPSDNFSKPIINSDAKMSDKVYLLAQPTVEARFDNGKGMRLVLVNATKDVVAFDAADSQLFIVQEAQDETGKWKRVESLPIITCGNSFHRVMLEPGRFWEFAAPRYEGTFKTKLRFRMSSIHESQIWISNEFDGSVNPDQFHKTHPYEIGPYSTMPTDQRPQN